MPVSKNTWNKGLNSDLSKLKSQQDSYLDGKNIRVITDEGTSTFAVENIRGNKYNFKLPTVEATYLFFLFDNSTGTAQITLSRSVTDPGTGLTFIDSVLLQVQNIQSKSYEFIANELNTAIIGATPQFTGSQYIRFYYNSAGIVLYDFKPQSEVNWGSLSISTSNINYSLRTNKIISHVILGWGYYNDNLVLISCSTTSSSDVPNDTEGFIWDCTYDNSTGNITTTQLDGLYLNPNTTLKYAGKLNLSRNYAINKHLKCRYESSEIVTIVWTDWYNNLRTCNIQDPQIWASPEELFSYIPVHLPQKPVISRLIIGGTLPTGKYQYFYQLYSNQGASSTFSPLSSLVALFPGELNTINVTGALPGISAQKSVEIQLTNLDTNYDNIRIGYVIYQTLDFPEAFFFDEREIPDDGNLTLIHNGTENDIPVDSTEIANLNRTPEVFKTIDVVRNRLFAANAITKYFDPVFDARAYRFEANTEAKLYNDNDIYNNPSVFLKGDLSGQITSVIIEGNSPTGSIYNQLLQIPDKFDLINPYNNENPDPTVNPYNNNSWEFFSQYKFKADGVTYGGQGPNISYEFIVETKLPKLEGLRNNTPYIAPAMDSRTTFTAPFDDTYTYYGSSNTALDSMKNPYIETLFTGYARGEVYRFGIVFYDVYGYPSYVNWIGDIKFPLACDANGFFGLTNNKTGSSGFRPVSSDLLTNQIGIKFTLDTSTPQFQAIRNQISGWSYVRVKRDLNNKTRLGTGYMQPTWYVDPNGRYTLMPLERVNQNDAPPYINHYWKFNEPIGSSSFWRTQSKLQTFYAPNFLLRTVGDWIQGDYMRMIGRTCDFGSGNIVQYSQLIGAPLWNQNIKLYYIASSDFDYTYDDGPFGNNPAVATSEVTSAIPIYQRDKYEITGSIYTSYSTSSNSITAGTISGLDYPFYIMASSNRHY